MKPRTVVAVSAGLGVPSSTRLLADRLTEAVRGKSADQGIPVATRTIELRDLAGAIADNLVAGFPGRKLGNAIDAVTAADALIAVTPVFTASYSGLFKSFFDLVDNTALTGKPVLIAATGGTARHALVLEHAMRPLFSYLRAVVVPTAVYAAAEDWGRGAGPGCELLAERIDRAAAELADLVRRTPSTTRPAGTQDGDVAPFEQQLAALRVD